MATIAPDALVASERAEGEDIEFTRAQETELPRVLKWRMLSADEDYEAVTVEARRVTVESVSVQAEQFAIAHPPASADRNARRALFEAWIGRETATFALPPSRLALDPTDVVVIENDGRYLNFALTQIADGVARRMEATRRDQAVYGMSQGPSRVSRQRFQWSTAPRAPRSSICRTSARSCWPTDLLLPWSVHRTPPSARSRSPPHRSAPRHRHRW